MTQYQLFGGDWTEEKLDRVRQYLKAYAKIMSNQPFHTIYIDAFAGTGYRTLKAEEDPSAFLFPELVEQEPTKFLDGSARISLEIKPRFAEYIFIEKDDQRFAELEKLKNEYSQIGNRIHPVHQDANSYLASLCRERNWREDRAVLFLDPFGMEVQWTTIQAIAATKAIDVWYLFPLTVNRLLRRDGNISEQMRAKVTSLLGNSDWENRFYKRETDLFGERPTPRKVANFSVIINYVLERLKSVFPAVAENPLVLSNSKNSPLFLLCFAIANEGKIPQEIALRVAQHILKP